MQRLSKAILLSVLIPFSCGKTPEAPPTGITSQQVESTDDLELRLRGIAENGWGGSAFGGLKEGIEKLLPEKSGPLLQDLAELEKTTDTAEIKVIAKRMLEKL